MVDRSNCYSGRRLIRAEVGFDFICINLAGSFIFDVELDALDLVEDDLLQVHLLNELLEGVDDGFVLDKAVEDFVALVIVQQRVK